MSIPNHAPACQGNKKKIIKLPHKTLPPYNLVNQAQAGLDFFNFFLSQRTKEIFLDIS